MNPVDYNGAMTSLADEAARGSAAAAEQYCQMENDLWDEEMEGQFEIVATPEQQRPAKMNRVTPDPTGQAAMEAQAMKVAMAAVAQFNAERQQAGGEGLVSMPALGM